uniref:Proline synthase co-transcribed bacterial homolog protein n=1 Tax=Rhizophora mucronata TaxID=61149 RepID=A0A2P2K7Z8_RHIMU
MYQSDCNLYAPSSWISSHVTSLLFLLIWGSLKSLCRQSWSLTVFCLIPVIYCPAKSGVEPSGCVELAKHVRDSCPNLDFCGLMTIGMLDYRSTPENFKV